MAFAIVLFFFFVIRERKKVSKTRQLPQEKLGYGRTASESSSLVSGCICLSMHSTSSAAAILKIVLERGRLGSIFLRRSDWFFVMSLGRRMFTLVFSLHN